MRDADPGARKKKSALLYDEFIVYDESQVGHTLNVTNHKSHTTSHASHVTRHMSHVTCQKRHNSQVTIHASLQVKIEYLLRVQFTFKK